MGIRDFIDRARYNLGEHSGHTFGQGYTTGQRLANVGLAGVGAALAGGPGVKIAKGLSNWWNNTHIPPPSQNFAGQFGNNTDWLSRNPAIGTGELFGGQYTPETSDPYAGALQGAFGQGNGTITPGGTSGGDTFSPQFSNSPLTTPQYSGGGNTGIIPPNFNVQTGTTGGGNGQFGIDTYGLNQGPGLQQQNFPLNPMDTTINTGSNSPPPAGGGNGGGDPSQSAFGGRAGTGGGAFGSGGGGNTNFAGGGGGTLGSGSVVDPSQWGALGIGGDSGPMSGGFGPGYQLQMMSGGMHEAGGGGPTAGGNAMASALRKPGLGPLGRPMRTGGGAQAQPSSFGKVGTGGPGPVMPGQPGVGNTGIVPPSMSTGGPGQIQPRVGALRRRPPIYPPPGGGIRA